MSDQVLGLIFAVGMCLITVVIIWVWGTARGKQLAEELNI